jgi:hypothetical protein
MNVQISYESTIMAPDASQGPAVARSPFNSYLAVVDWNQKTTLSTRKLVYIKTASEIDSGTGNRSGIDPA